MLTRTSKVADGWAYGHACYSNRSGWFPEECFRPDDWDNSSRSSSQADQGSAQQSWKWWKDPAYAGTSGSGRRAAEEEQQGHRSMKRQKPFDESWKKGIGSKNQNWVQGDDNPEGPFHEGLPESYLANATLEEIEKMEKQIANWLDRARLLDVATVVAPASQMGGIFAKIFFEDHLAKVNALHPTPGFDIKEEMDKDIDQLPLTTCALCGSWTEQGYPCFCVNDVEEILHKKYSRRVQKGEIRADHRLPPKELRALALNDGKMRCAFGSCFGEPCNSSGHRTQTHKIAVAEAEHLQEAR